MTAPAPKQSLSGIRILDLTVMTAGPVGTMMLGDLGADIIKIEELKDGELSRKMGTMYIGQESVNFLSQNRNKRSVRLDLKKPEGRAAFLKMAAQADVVTENFRPGTLDRLGIGYAALRAINPGIIFASISAFGQSGPYAHLPANDPIVQALSGLMHMTGDAHGDPVRIGHPYPDFGAAALLAFGVCAALLHRERTGEGQSLDLSLLNGTIFSAIPRDGETLRSGKAPPRLGSGHPAFVPYRNFKGSDGLPFFLSCFTEKFWGSVCDALERPDLKDDARTRSNVDRCRNRDFVDTELQAIFATRTTQAWLERLATFNVPSAPVQDLHQALRHDPQVRHNQTIVQVEHPRAGVVETLALPVNFHGTPAQYHRPPPMLGEHSVQVLREFGFSEQEIDDLLAGSVIAGMDGP
jgi:crotonobetainyl-CoA:carnitine CoA-transferase CaiB-like acyl-CoA transferase